MITRSNYEIFFIDYFDGKLGKTGQEELFSFLKMNSDLQEEFNRYSGFQAEPELTIQYGNKDKLKKEIITLLNYKTWLVKYVENDLSQQLKKEVELFLTKNPTIKPELEILKQTRILPDHRIIFEKKNLLRKGGKVIYFNRTLKDVISVAAALIIVALAYYLIKQNNTPQNVISKSPGKNENRIINNENAVKDEIVANPFKEDTTKSHIIQNTKPVDKIMPMPVTQTNIPVEPLLASNPDTSNADVVLDSTKKSVINETPAQLTENKSMRSGININMAYHIEIPSIRIKQFDLSQNNISDIFDEEDLKELEDLQKSKLGKSQANTKTLLDLASEKIAEISKSANIAVEKQNDISGNSVTYAIGIGKNFSVSHTRGK